MSKMRARTAFLFASTPPHTSLKAALNSVRESENERATPHILDTTFTELGSDIIRVELIVLANSYNEAGRITDAFMEALSRELSNSPHEELETELVPA